MTGRPYLFESDGADGNPVEGQVVIVFTRRGRVKVQGGTELGPQDVAILSHQGARVTIEALEPSSQVLILSGQPLNEPISHHGPFVMNTRQEINQAISDYQSGNFGT